jgi:hypothetical protein
MSEDPLPSSDSVLLLITRYLIRHFIIIKRFSMAIASLFITLFLSDFNSLESYQPINYFDLVNLANIFLLVRQPH